MAHVAKIEQAGDVFEVACPECGTVGSADDEVLADLVKRLHSRAFQLVSVTQEAS